MCWVHTTIKKELFQSFHVHDLLLLFQPTHFFRTGKLMSEYIIFYIFVVALPSHSRLIFQVSFERFFVLHQVFRFACKKCHNILHAEHKMRNIHCRDIIKLTNIKGFFLGGFPLKVAARQGYSTLVIASSPQCAGLPQNIIIFFFFGFEKWQKLDIIIWSVRFQNGHTIQGIQILNAESTLTEIWALSIAWLTPSKQKISINLQSI